MLINDFALDFFGRGAAPRGSDMDRGLRDVEGELDWIVVSANTPKINISVTAATTAIGRSIEWRIKSMGGILPQSRHSVARHDPLFYGRCRYFAPHQIIPARE